MSEENRDRREEDPKNPRIGFFDLEARGTSLSIEINGGVTTFLTMSYIIFLQPIILSKCGMDANAVMVATCISSALATLAMAVFTHYPIALAPAVGHNLFFTFTVCLTMGYTWQVALAANLIAGILFVLLTLVGLQTALIRAVSESLKHSIAVGIGLLIAFLGLQWSGIIVDTPGVLVRLGNMSSPPVLLSLGGLFVIAVLMVMKVRAAFILGMVAMTLAGLLVTSLTKGSETPVAMVTYQGIIGKVPDLGPTLFKLDLQGLADLGFVSILTVVLIFLFLDVFDTMGTLIGVGEQAGFVKDGMIPRAKGAFLADGLGTVVGTLLGTSTVTSYVESAAGVSAGARTGVANLVTAALFLLALFFSPLVEMISGGYQAAEGVTLYPVLGPVLIMVGYLMMKSVTRIQWGEMTEGLPAFLTITFMMFSFSITEGIAMGFVTTSVLKTAAGRFRDVSMIIHVMAVLFILRWLFLSG